MYYLLFFNKCIQEYWVVFGRNMWSALILNFLWKWPQFCPRILHAQICHFTWNSWTASKLQIEDGESTLIAGCGMMSFIHTDLIGLINFHQLDNHNGFFGWGLMGLNHFPWIYNLAKVQISQLGIENAQYIYMTFVESQAILYDKYHFLKFKVRILSYWER